MRLITGMFCTLAVLVFGGGMIHGQGDPGFDYSMKLTKVVYDPNTGDATVCVPLQIASVNDPDDSDGFSMGIIHDDALLTPSSVEQASVLANIDPDVFIVDLDPVGGPGITIDVLYDDDGLVQLAFNEDTAITNPTIVAFACYDLVTDTFLDNLDGDTATLTWIDSLGDPVIVNEVLVGTETTAASTLDGTVEINPAFFTFYCESANGTYNVETGVGTAKAKLSASENPDSPGFPNDTQGIQMSLGHDDNFLTATDIVGLGILNELNDGEGPDFLGFDLDAEGGDGGVVIGVVHSLFKAIYLNLAAEPDEILEVSYETVTDEFIDNEDGLTTPLIWIDGLGIPPIKNGIVIEELVNPVLFSDGGIDWEVGTELFKRGDMDGNGVVFSLIDALYILSWAFTGGDAPGCLDAADADDNGQVFALLDALYLLTWAFVNGPTPPDPGPDECGTDPGLDDGVTCETPPSC